MFTNVNKYFFDTTAEPWRYSIISNSRKIEKYLDFLDDWYEDHLEELTDQEITTFKTKLLRGQSFTFLMADLSVKT